MIESCPGPGSLGDTRVIDSQRGVKIDFFLYWNDVFKLHGLDNTKVEIRVDPWDVSIVYALVRGNWYTCISKLRGLMRTFTREEVRALFEELKVRHRIRKSDVPAHRIKEWIQLLNSGHFDSRISVEMGEERVMCEELGLIRPLHTGEIVCLSGSAEITLQGESPMVNPSLANPPSVPKDEGDPSATEFADQQGEQDDGNYLF